MSWLPTLMNNLLKRITFNQDVLCGKATIRGLRISVEMILELLAQGATIEEILEDYPPLELEDIYASLQYALQLVKNEEVVPNVAVTR